MYRLGQLTQRIDFEMDVKTPDGGGGNTNIPTVFASCWAYVREKSAREIVQGQAIAAVASKIFVVRWRDDVHAGHRIIWRGARYNIRTEPDPNSRELFLEVEAEFGVAQ